MIKRILCMLIFVLLLPGVGWGAVTYGLDIVTNNGFEADVTGWSLVSTPTVTQSNEQAHTGTYSCKVVADAATEGIVVYGGTTGTWYLLDIWVYVSSGQVRIIYDNQTIATLTNIGQWIHVRRNYRYTNANNGFKILSYNAAATFYVDDVYLKPIDFNSTYSCKVNNSSDMIVSNTISLVQYTLPSLDLNQVGLIINVDNPTTPTNYILIYYNNATGKITVDECVNGTYTANKIAASAVFDYPNATSLRIERSGTNLTIWYGGVWALSGTVTASSWKNYSSWSPDDSNTTTVASMIPQIIPITNAKLSVVDQYTTFTATDYDSRGVWGFIGGSTHKIQRLNSDNSVITATQTVSGAGNISFYSWDQDGDGTNEQFFIYGVLLTADPTKLLILTYCNGDTGTTTGKAGKYYVFQGTVSADTGAAMTIDINATPVLMLGDTDGTVANQIVGVNILLGNQGYLRLKQSLPGGGGIGDLYIGEYNTNGSRTPGGANDLVRLMKSADNGGTWSEVAHWNTSSHQIAHIHSVTQDPYTGNIIVVGGDTNAESGMFVWDGVTAVTSNAAFSTYAAAGLYGVAGSTKYKPINPLFGPNYFLTYNDVNYGSDTASEGFWKHTKNLVTSTRIQPILRYLSGNAVTGWLGFKMGNTYFYTSNGGSGWSNIYAADNEVGPWRAVARIATVNYPGFAIVTDSQTVYLSGYANEFAEGNNWTIKCQVIGTFRDNHPITLSPVRWVKLTGSDATGDGLHPSTAWRTLGKALGNVAPIGSRIILDAGTYQTEDSMTPVMTAGTGFVAPTVVEGQGKGLTFVKKKSDGANAYFFTCNSTLGEIQFKDLNLSSLKTDDTSEAIISSGGAVSYFDVIAGPTYNTGVNIKNSGGTFKSRRSMLQGHATAASNIVMDTAASTVDLQYSNLTESVISVDFGVAASVLTMLNNNIIGYSTAGVQFEVGSDNPQKATILNNKFVGDASTSPLKDLSGATEIGGNIDYNYFNQAVTDVVTGTHNITSLTLANSAQDIGLRYDYSGIPVPIGSFPDIGSQEFAGGGLTSGLGLSGGNAPPWVRKKNQ